MSQHIQLVIHEINGESLLPMDRNGSSDPYLKLYQGDIFIYKTPVIKSSLNPSWNEKIKITLDPDCDLVVFKVILLSNIRMQITSQL